MCEKFEFSRTSKERYTGRAIRIVLPYCSRAPCTKIIRDYSQKKKKIQSILDFKLLAGEIKRLVIIARQLLEYPRKTEIAQLS